MANRPGRMHRPIRGHRPPRYPRPLPPPADAGRAFLAENGNRGPAWSPPLRDYSTKCSPPATALTPGPTDRVTTHYHGTLIDGRVFDSSMQRGEPIEFPVNGVISGWTEALQLMRGWAYPVEALHPPRNWPTGKRGAGGVIGPDETLIFEVELLGVRSG